MQKQIDKVTREILKKITPSVEEKARMKALAKALELKVSAVIQDFGIEAIVRVEGSVAKDTWLSRDPDLDIFMRLPTSVPRSSLGEVSLGIARKATEGSEQVERFAEHPYLEAFVDGTRLNIVPCYSVKSGEWLSATDRTPFHTDYINEKLAPSLRDDVRLLKKFMKGIGVYGAEIKVGGFSGYLCELLILHFGSFQKVLEAFAKHLPRRVIDMECYYARRERELELLFPESLVIVDPVDKARNVASAVQPHRLYTFAAASCAFLKEPSLEFFEPLKIQALSVEEMLDSMKNRGSNLIFVALGKIDAVPDILWGQLYRTKKALRKQLELRDFNVIRDGVWSEDKSTVTVFVLELEQQIISSIKKHLGPPLEFQEECERFLEKYSENAQVVSGPFIEGARWVVMLKRKNIDAVEVLSDLVSSGGRDVGVAELVAKALKQNPLVLVGEEVTAHYIYNRGFAVFLTEFISGKPFWLDKKC